MTTESTQRQYSGAFVFSLIIHCIIFGFFFLGLQFSNKPPVPFQSQNIVKAVTVNQAEVEQQISKIQQQKQQEEQAKVAEQEKMQKKLEEFHQKQKQEQAKLEQLKQQQEKQIAAQKAQEQKLAAIKEQQSKEAERITKLKQEQQTLEKTKLAAEQQVQKLKEQKQKLADKTEKTEKADTKPTKNKKVLDDIQKEVQKEDAEKEAASSKKKSQKDLAKKASQEKPEKDELDELVASAEMQGEIDRYKSLILRAIGHRWRIPENADPSLACKLLIKLGPGGVVLDVRVVESSGDQLLDRSAVLAVQKASPLPVPEAKDVFSKFREFKLTVRPESILSSA